MFIFKVKSMTSARAAMALVLLFAGFVAIGCGLDRLTDAGEPSGDVANDTDDHAPFAVGELHDPLSMPMTATVSVDNFRQSMECMGCHPNHFAEWKTSMHAYAMVDPVFRALVALRQSEFGGERDQFCTQCHSAIGTRGGEVYPMFTFEELSPVSLEGVTCEACHKVAELRRPYNSGHVLDETGPMRGPIMTPLETTGHESAFSPLHDTSEFCAGCHDVVEQDGLVLERPYEEWLDSPAATDRRNCQSCHMPTYRGKVADLARVPERDNVHRHRFIGVDMPLTEGFIPDEAVREEVRGEIIDLLRSAGSIELEAAETVTAGDAFHLCGTLRNLIDGHNLPTGSTFNRQLWIAVTATDAQGNILYQTGHLDDNNDLRNYWSELDQNGDSDLLSFGSELLDEQGNPTLFSWRAAEHISNTISPLGARTFTLSIPTELDTVGPITVAAQLRFRALPPYLLRTLGLDDLVEKLEIHNIDEDSITVEVAP